MRWPLRIPKNLLGYIFQEYVTPIFDPVLHNLSGLQENFLALRILKFIMEERVQGKPPNPSYPPVHFTQLWPASTITRGLGYNPPLPCWVRSNYARASIFSS